MIDALVRFYERDNSNVHRGLHALSMRSTDGYEGARTRVAKFINAADPAEVDAIVARFVADPARYSTSASIR